MRPTLNDPTYLGESVFPFCEPISIQQVDEQAASFTLLLDSLALGAECIATDYPINSKQRGLCKLNVESRTQPYWEQRKVRTTTDSTCKHWYKPHKSTYSSHWSGEGPIITFQDSHHTGPFTRIKRDCGWLIMNIYKGPRFCLPNYEDITYALIVREHGEAMIQSFAPCFFKPPEFMTQGLSPYEAQKFQEASPCIMDPVYAAWLKQYEMLEYRLTRILVDDHNASSPKMPAQMSKVIENLPSTMLRHTISRDLERMNELALGIQLPYRPAAGFKTVPYVM